MDAERIVIQCNTQLTGIFKKLLAGAGAKIVKSGIHPYNLDGHLFYVQEFEVISPDLTQGEIKRLIQSYMIGLTQSVRVGVDPSPPRSNQAHSVAKLPLCPSIRQT